jgi:hypothetical protein
MFLGGFVVFGIVMWAELAYSLGKGRDRTLTHRAARALRFLAAAPADSPELREAKYEEFEDSTPEGNLIRVYDAHGHVLYPKFT